MTTTDFLKGLPMVLAMLAAGCGGSGGGSFGFNVTPAPPAGLTYHDASVVYAQGNRIVPDRPTASGGPITHYTLQPPLPAGLSLDSQSGVITGTPASTSNATIYTVTGSNPEGNTTARVEIEVKDHVIAPDELGFLDSVEIYVTNEPITPNTPISDGGEITQFTIVPDLPAGLALDPQSGVISGTPTAVTAQTVYTITGSNSAGSVETQIKLEVQAQVMPPADLDYADEAPVYTVGIPVVYDEPEYDGGEITAFVIAPPLPPGLSLNALTGAISGTPTAAHAKTTYTITGTNGAGSVSTQITITVDAPLVGEWLPADAMNNKGRIRHTATLLANGKVLVAGGFGPGGTSQSTELYDPASDTWSNAGSLSQQRQNATATLLRDGRVLVAGGHGSGGGSSLASAELYDPAAGTWSQTGSMSIARDTHTATLLPDGRVLVAGGEGANSAMLSSAELFDPGTGAWSPTGSLSQARDLHSATLLPDGRVLVAGGWDGSSKKSRLASAELYDPGTGSWSPTPGSLVQGRSLHGAVLLPDGKVLVVAGNDGTGALASAELFDPATGGWSQTGSLIVARDDHTVTALATGQVLAAGGGSKRTLASVELYDPATGAWSSTASLGHARYSHVATPLSDGRVLVVGGFGKGGYLSSAELFH
jgi:hypothetical protein